MTCSTTNILLCGILFFGFLTLIIAAKECLQNKMGIQYTGTVSTSNYGLKCKMWSNVYGYEEDTNLYNFCRNPDYDPEGPWCFTNDNPDFLEVEYCTIPFCADEVVPPKPVKVCKDNQLGVDYTGNISTTETGRTCQIWSESYPHSHQFTLKLAYQHNFCRNPDNEPFGPWCYTTDSDIRWEYCTVPFCDGYLKPDQDCRMNKQGKNYTGTISKTRHGQKCQAWSSVVPHDHQFSVKLADQGNYCRNPDNEENGPWCYTTDPDTKYEFCDIPYCSVSPTPPSGFWSR